MESLGFYAGSIIRLIITIIMMITIIIIVMIIITIIIMIIMIIIVMIIMRLDFRGLEAQGEQAIKVSAC